MATIEHPLPDDLIVLIARRFQVLAEPTRIKLLERLRDGEASVHELSEAIGSTQQNISKHLGVLLQAGLVCRRRDGNYSYYAIVDSGIFTLCDAVCGSVAAQLDSLRRSIAAGGW